MFSVNQVSKKIVAMRKERNMTQTELADRMGVSFQAVSNWERGNSMPDISKLPQLAEVFGCSLEDLLEEKSGLLDSAMEDTDTLKEYVEQNDVPREELEAVVPVLKPGQVDTIAKGISMKNNDDIVVFYPFLDDDTMRELAERKRKNNESIPSNMLPFLRKEFIGELALEQYEKKMPITYFYPFIDSKTRKELAERKRKKGESILDMLPFLGKEYIREVALEQCEKGMSITYLYPFLNKETRRELAERKLKKGESISDMLPFLEKDFLKAMVLG